MPQVRNTAVVGLLGFRLSRVQDEFLTSRRCRHRGAGAAEPALALVREQRGQAGRPPTFSPLAARHRLGGGERTEPVEGAEDRPLIERRAAAEGGTGVPAVSPRGSRRSAGGGDYRLVRAAPAGPGCAREAQSSSRRGSADLVEQQQVAVAAHHLVDQQVALLAAPESRRRIRSNPGLLHAAQPGPAQVLPQRHAEAGRHVAAPAAGRLA